MAAAEGGWLARRLQRHVDRAAQRMHDRLAASPESFRRTPSTIGVTAFSFGVLAVALGGVAALVWLTIAVDSWAGYALAALGWLVVLASVGRSPRLPADVHVLDEGDHPWVSRLVRDLSDAVGVAPPDIVGVSSDMNAYVTPVGLRRRSALVIGLALWTLETDDEKLGTLAHELGHLRGRDTARSRIVGFAHGLLLRWYLMIHPGHYYSSGELVFGDLVPFGAGQIGGFGGEGTGLLGRVAERIQAILAWPIGVLLLLFDRLHANSRQHEEYLADRRAAMVAGSAAMASGLRLDHLGLETSLRSAVIRGEDPFDYLASRQSDQGLRRAQVLRDSVHRADATHPPDDLRISLLEALDSTPAASGHLRDALSGADQELVALRPKLARQLIHELRAAAW